MSSGGKQMERIWAHWRQRYNVAGKSADTRTRRRGSVRCQELRAEAARLVDWFRILLLNGWLGSNRITNDQDVAPVYGRARLSNVLRKRERAGLRTFRTDPPRTRSATPPTPTPRRTDQAASAVPLSTNTDRAPR